MKNVICFLVLSNASFAIANATQVAEAIKPKYLLCESSKEYITAFRYLEAQKSYSLKKEEVMKIADVVSKGCNGSAKRFIEINELLVKAGLETSDSLKIAIKFADRSDQTTDTFSSLFKESFLKDYLDLELKDSIDISMKLALETDSDATMIKNDFQKIVKFCLDQKGLDLSGPKCSDLASKVALSGTRFKSEMASTFLDHFNFLTDKSGADLATYKAVELSVKLIDGGPMSVTNFKDAYKFAISKSGLDLGKKEAINYAELMAERSKLESRTK
jgi:hypothetical protein